MTVLSEVQKRIHVRYDGQTFDFPFSDLDISDNPDDKEILEVAEEILVQEIGRDVDFAGYMVDRHDLNGLYDVHPTAKFGA
jgi:hypothetical protein